MNPPITEATASEGAPSAAGIVADHLQGATAKDDPLVKVWMDRIKAAEKHWGRFHQRVRYNRDLVQGIDITGDVRTPHYNKKRANLIKSTLSVVLSKVYAKNPEISAEPTNKAKNLRLFCETVSGVTQRMLEDAKLKNKAKRAVRAAMTCSHGIVKVMYQRDIEIDPIIKDRIEDTQDNIKHIESLLAQIEGEDSQRHDLEAKKRELEMAIEGLQAKKEVVASEGLTVDMTRTDRLLLDPAIDDILDYEQSAWIIEKIPKRRSEAMGLFPDYDLSHASTFKVGEYDIAADKARPYSRDNKASGDGDDPLVLIYEAWSKTDNMIYTMVAGCNSQFARAPYSPTYTGERWWPYFILPWGVVDGQVVSQSLVDDLEKLEVEHNETRDKFAEVRRNIRPHMIISADVKDKQITRKMHPEIGEMVVIDTGGQPIKDFALEGTQLKIDPAVYDTSPIAYDWDQTSGLQEAARSVITKAKTATEASISDQSLGARVGEFRDSVEDWLTEIAQYSAELCLLAMTEPMVAQIMGEAEPVDPNAIGQAVLSGQPPPEPVKPYEWPAERTPETVFQLVQMKIRAGSTAAPNKLEMQETWTKALPLLQTMIQTIMQVEAMGGDGTPYRELVKETAARFDESLDVDRFLPPKPMQPAIPQIPGQMPGMPMPGGIPGQPTLQ